MDVIPIPLLTDNYAYLVHAAGTTVVIDPSTAQPIKDVLDVRGWKLDAVLNTHHHWDHVGGNLDLKHAYGCPVYGPLGDEARIAGFDHALEGGKKFQLRGLKWDILFIPGHTLHHVALWDVQNESVFTGDTLFLMGCGRIFEGTPAQMWASLEQLAALPDATRVYCGHEYTLANLRFAEAVSGPDPALKLRREKVEAWRQQNLPTVPATIAEEKATNPFFRLADKNYRESLYPGASALDAFTQLRKKKDTF